MNHNLTYFFQLFCLSVVQCGKVCLSLLGTWGGGVGEGWSAQNSTLLQVCVSIQSLIFVEQPWANEPSYEQQLGTPAGHAACVEYNRPLYLATTQWAMLDQLRNPPKGFEQVVRAHFALKKDAILAQLADWAKLNAEVKPLIDEMKIELDKLPSPAEL